MFFSNLTLTIIDTLQVSAVVTTIDIGKDAVLGATKVFVLASSARESSLTIAIGCGCDTRQGLNTTATIHTLNLTTSTNTLRDDNKT